MNSRTSHRGKRISKQQEKRTAADLGGRTQANSGATRLGGGGDVRVAGDTRVECKVTEASVYTLKKSELEKLRNQAIKSLEAPVFQFAFRDRLGQMDSYVVIPGFTKPGKNEDYHDLHTHYNSMRLEQSYLRSTLWSGKRLCVTFQDGNPWNKQWEIMTWTKFMNNRQEGEG